MPFRRLNSEFNRRFWRGVFIFGGVAILSIGYVDMEATQRQTNEVAVETNRVATKNKTLVNRLKHEEAKSCQRSNDANDSLRNLLAYLRDRQRAVSGQVTPVTPEQQAAFEAAVALVPANQDCSAPMSTEGGK